MLIKYRSGVVHSSPNYARCMSRTGIVASRSIVHMRSSFVFKRPKPSWRPTIYVNRSMHMMEETEEIDPHTAKLIVTHCFQFLLFILLFIVGVICGLSHIFYYRVNYAFYFFTHVRLAELKTTLAAGCLYLTDLPCSLQTHLNIYFFWTKLMPVYYSSIIIAMIYTWHRTVRLFSCFFALFVIIVIVFGTDFILYFDDIYTVSCMVCLELLLIFPYLSLYLSRNVEDPLSVLCGYNVPSDDIYEFLQNDNSKRACFYRWAKKMKIQWNIEEEKLIITITVGLITSIITITGCAYILPLDRLGVKRHF